MKKIIFLMFTVMIIAAFSCKRSDEVMPSSPTTNQDSSTLADQAIAPVPVIVAGSRDHAGYTNATGGSARFNQPSGIFVNPDGTLLVADSRNGAVRKIANSVVSTVVKDARLVGTSSLAASKDGTIALNDEGETVLFKSGNLTFLENIGCPHCSTGGLSKSSDNSFFWYLTNIYDGESAVHLNAISPNGDNLHRGGIIAESDAAPVYATAVSTTLNDNKFVTLQHTIYELTHSGTLAHILPNTTFDGLTSIAVNKDGTKLYVADNGDIKLITRCNTCPTLLTVLVAHADASGLALSNSEKVLFFTSSKHHTVNKINLP
jgi:DNA-binding beta-propeller fold protein YncE